MKSEEQDGLDEIWDMDEIEGQFYTPLDKFIADTDIPERLQTRIKSRMQPDEEELTKEADWVFERFKQLRTEDLFGEVQMKKKIFMVLKLFRKDCFDVSEPRPLTPL